MGLSKAKIIIEHTGDEIDVMFNPEEYTLAKDNNFASQTIPGLSSPILLFVHGNLRTLEMELFFDTTDRRSDVRAETGKVTGLLDIASELHAPPVLRIAWASLQFRGVLTRVSQQFTKFLETGAPVRARLSVSFSEFIDEEREAKEVNRQTADFTKVHIAKPDDTLSRIATRYYQDPLAWRAIALANNIDDPFAIRPGDRLVVPSLPFAGVGGAEVS